jgi:hypothetical protein
MRTETLTEGRSNEPSTAGQRAVRAKTAGLLVLPREKKKK